MSVLLNAILSVAPAIRYVAILREGKLESFQRPGLTDASAGESDRYEELFVNPTILTAAAQRGNLDCGGLRYVLIRYGNFFQVIVPTVWGHASICFEPTSMPLDHVEQICRIIEED